MKRKSTARPTVQAQRRLGRAFALMLLCAAGMSSATAQSVAISGADGTVTVSWPQTNYYFELQAASDLSANTWTNIGTASSNVSWMSCYDGGGCTPVNADIVGDQFALTLPATNDMQWFRLRSQKLIAVCQFAFFYNLLLEFTSTATLTVKGPVHANASIYTGSSSIISFSNTVTASGSISSPPNNGTSTWASTGLFNGVPPQITNVPPLILFGLGTNDPHTIIEMPPPGEPAMGTPGQSRLYNQAEVIVVVSNSTASLRVQSSSAGALPGADPTPLIVTFTNSPASLASNLPFMTLTNTFFDQRELKWALVTQIDVGRYSRWIQTNTWIQAKFPVFFGVFTLYAADNRTVTPTQMTVVRIVNGAAPWSMLNVGFTLITPNPLYVVGNFNQTNALLLNTNNTSSGTVPCALVSDALTILSTNWSDAQSTNNYTFRKAANTTVNAAIITGVVPSIDTSNTGFSGGAHNLVRLLEDWLFVPGGQRSLTINGSFICLFKSQHATALFRNPGNFGLANSAYYDPPKRQFAFDPNFIDPGHLPPSIPLVTVAPPGN